MGQVVDDLRKSKAYCVSSHFPGGIYQQHIGDDGLVGRGRLVGAESDSDVEGAIQVQLDGIADLVHRFAVHADEHGEGVTALFYADALGQSCVEAIGAMVAAMVDPDFLHHLAFFRPPGEVHEAASVEGYHGFFGIIIETLANDDYDLAVVIPGGIRKGGVGCQRDVAGHFCPDVAKLIPVIPDVVASRDDRIGAGRRIIAGGPGHERGSYVGLAPETAEGDHACDRGAMKVRGRRHLFVGGGAG